MGSKNNDSRIELTSTEQTKKGKVLSQENWIVGRSDPSTAIKSIVREKFTNNPYKGKSDGVVRIMSGESERPNTWRDWIPFIGGTKPEPELIYRGKAIDDNRHDTLPDSEGSDDNIFQLLPKFHAAESVPVNYNDIVRVRYYDINNNFVGVVGIIEENLGSSTNDSNGPGTAGSRQPGGGKTKKRMPIPNPFSSSSPADPVYPVNPVTGKPVKTSSEMKPYVNSYTGPRNLSLKGSSKDHPGLDLKAVLEQKIYAAMDGEIAVRLDSDDPAAKKGYGYYAAIKTTGLEGLDPIYTLYGHLGEEILSRFPRTFNGTTIKAGAQIGLMMDTGNSTGPHLHFGVVYGPELSSPGAVALQHKTNVFDPMTEFFGRVYQKI